MMTRSMSGGGRQLKSSALLLLVSCWLIGYNGGVQAQYDPCSLCRDGQIITAGDSILEDGFAFVLDEALTCEAVQRMARAGSFTNIECALLRSYGSATECGCQDAPLTSPPFIDGTCGEGDRGNGVCADGTCCSQYGFCGTTEEYCTTTCGNGNRGDGVCPDEACCSQYGYCGTGDEYCTASLPTRAPTIPAEEQSGEVYVRLFPVETELTITSGFEAACAKFYQAALNLQQVSCEVVSSNIACRILQGGRFLRDASFTLDLLSRVTGTGPVFDDFQAALVDALNKDPDTFANDLNITGHATSQLYFRSVDSVVAYDPNDEIPGPTTKSPTSGAPTSRVPSRSAPTPAAPEDDGDKDLSGGAKFGIFLLPYSFPSLF